MSIDVTPGTGKTVAADVIAGEQYQRIKVAWGVTGAAVDASATNPFPVTVANSVAVTGSFWQAIQPVSLTALPALAAGSAIVGKFGIDQTSPGVTNGFSVSHIGTTAVATGNGTVSAGVQRVAISSDNTPFTVNAAQSGAWNITNISGTISLPTGASTAANQATLNAGIGAPADASATTDTGTFSLIALFKRALGYLATIAGAASDTTTASPVRDANAGEYEFVAASATTQAIGATGAVGDWFSHIVIIPATTSPGAVAIKDGSGTAMTIFAGGASSVTSLAPITVALDLKSVNGAWQVTTGTNVSAIAAGNFT